MTETCGPWSRCPLASRQEMSCSHATNCVCSVFVSHPFTVQTGQQSKPLNPPLTLHFYTIGYKDYHLQLFARLCLVWFKYYMENFGPFCILFRQKCICMTSPCSLRCGSLWNSFVSVCVCPVGRCADMISCWRRRRRWPSGLFPVKTLTSEQACTQLPVKLSRRQIVLGLFQALMPSVSWPIGRSLLPSAGLV